MQSEPLMDIEPNNPLEILVGREMSAVSFVRDYLQLHFDGPRLTLITDPVVQVDNVYYRAGMPGYRDALVGLVSKTVRRTSIVEGEAITLEYDDRTRISISLRSNDYQSAEAAVFDTGTSTWSW